MKLECKFEQALRWEDDARERGITFGRSLVYRERRRAFLSTENQTGLMNNNAGHDMKMYKDVTKKRQVYLFVSSTFEDFEKLYDVKEMPISSKITILPKESSLAKVAIDNVDNTQDDKTDGKTSALILKKGDVVDWDSLVLLEHDLGLNDRVLDTETEDSMVSFFSNSIPRLFSSQNPRFDHQIDSDERNAHLTVDDIFLRSFSSPHLIHLSAPPSPSISATQSQIPGIEHLQRFEMPQSASRVEPAMGSLEQQLLRYFVERICPNCVCYPKVRTSAGHAHNANVSAESNPYLYLIVPLAKESPLVLNALIASSAKQLVLLGESNYEMIAKKYSYEVLQELPRVISAKQQANENNWDEIFATMIMLCFTEISVSCNNSWLVHLKGAKQFLRESCIQNNLSPIGKFFVRYFISHEVMAETAWVYDTSQHSLRPITDDPYIETLKNDEDTNIDLVLGCSPYLISLIHKTSVLGKCFEDLEMESSDDRAPLEKEILMQADILEHALLTLDQKLPVMEEVDETDKESSFYVDKIAEIKRLAALVYLYARIHLEYQFYHGHKCPGNRQSSKAKTYIKKIIELHALLPGCYVSLLWPVFIVGIVSVEDDERWFVLDSMTEMEKDRELRSVKSAKDVVLSVWRERDLGCSPARWKEMIQGKANTISLA